MRSGLADIVGFEPNPDALDRLNAMKGSNELYLPHAVADGERHILRFCQAPGMTSLLEPNSAVLNLFHGFPDWGRVVSREAVETVKLDDIEATRGVDLIKIDIQGAELMAFRSGEKRLRHALVVQTEVEFLPLYVDQPLFGDVDRFMRECGFMFHRFHPVVSRVVRPLLIDNNIFAGMSQLVWADALFIRDITRLELLSDDDLIGMATIMHDCYGSIDISLHLLTEYDLRRKTACGAAYLEGLRSRAS